jgi:hypothetical protein
MLRDLVALGRGAPVRVAYEMMKRSGIQGAILRALSRGSRSSSLLSLPVLRADQIPSAVAHRCLHDAARIVKDGHRVFGRRMPIGTSLDWHRVGPDADVWSGFGSWPRGEPWWRIDIRTARRIGDVKFCWELGRHRDLVVLARAATLDPSGDWHVALVDRLRSWLSAAPAETGVHWYSNLEIGLRAFAWAQIVSLRGHALPTDVRQGMGRQIAQSRRHLLVDFPYTASSMRNNHLLGDALGLLTIARLTGRPTGTPTARFARRAFHRQLSQHMRDDGSMVEDSLSYHRFVLEMLAAMVLVGEGSPQVREALRTGARHLVRLGAFDGELPQWGDWDEGRVLATSGEPLDIAGSTALALVLAGEPTAAEWWQRFDEVAWYAPWPAGARTLAGYATSAVAVSGGMARVSVGDWRVWFKCGTAPSHGHADLTHVSVRSGQQWIVVDPGTGTYNGPLTVRNGFRCGSAHNGLQINGLEMFVPHRVFRWLTTAKVRLGAPIILEDGILVWGAHDAFTRGPGGGRVARAVITTRERVVCVDWREPGTPSAAELVVAKPPRPGAAGPQLFGLEGATITCGEWKPFQGWHSDTYGRWEPAPWLVRKFNRPGPVVWGIAGTADAKDLVTLDEAVTVGRVTVEATFEQHRTGLLVTTPVGSQTRYVPIGRRR